MQVPKFGSFRPKPREAVSNVDIREQPNASHDDDRSRSPVHRRGRHARDSQKRGDAQERHHGHPRKRSAERRHVTIGQELTRPNDSIDEVDNGDLYTVDRSGDGSIVQYETNARSSIPSYRPTQERQTLGDHLPFRNHQPARRLLSKLGRTELSQLQKEPRVLAVAKTPDKVTASAAVGGPDPNYVPLRAGTKRRRTGVVDERARISSTILSEQSEESSTDDYEASDGDGQQPVHDPRPAYSVASQNHARLAARLKKEPSNAEAWQDYIDFQETWLDASQGDQGAERTSSERRSIAEIRLSLYEEALSKLGALDPAHDLFHLRLLEQGGQVWESSKVARKWNETIARNPESIELRLAFLDHAQTSAGFTFEACRTLYVELLRLLSKQDPSGNVAASCRRLYIVLRFTFMARSSGYHELARSVWQGLLGLQTLSDGNGQDDVTLQAFEDFWDSERPRMGEQALAQATQPPEGSIDKAVFAWYEAEMTSSQEAALSVRNTDTLDDPYHVVLFDDIRPFLFRIPLKSSSLLIDAFLCFHRLPPLPSKSTALGHAWWRDSWFQDSSAGPNWSGLSTPSILFGGSSPLAAIADGSCVRDTLRALVHTFPDNEELAIYYVALLSHNFPTHAPKEAKAMVKSRPTSLRMYDAFAQLEWHSDNTAASAATSHTASRKVLESALKMSVCLFPDRRMDAVHLQRTLIWQELSLRNRDLAMKHLLRFEGANTYETLVQSRNAALAVDMIDTAVVCSEITALMPYLLDHFNISSALDAFSAEIAVLSTIGKHAAFAVELLYQTQAQLVSFHISAFKHYSPASLRPALQSSVRSAPDNTILLRLFAENDSRFLVDTRVRSPLLDTIVGDGESNAIAWLFYIGNEIEQGSGRGATQHSIRASFERAVNSKHGKHCQAVWVMYLLYEVSQAKHLARAKAVLYRAVAHVPWSKELVLVCIRHLVAVLEGPELKGLYDVMQQRELRLHTAWSSKSRR